MRLSFPAMALASAVALLIIALPGPAAARVSADDFGAGLTYTALTSSRAGSATVNQPFTVSAVVSWIGAQTAAGNVQITVTLPSGISWSGAAGSGCVRSGDQATCSAAVRPGQGTNLAATFGLGSAIARAPGSYTFSAALSPDGNPANDSFTLDVVVAAASAGGVSVKPARPKPGSTVVATTNVWSKTESSAVHLESGSVTCTAAVGKAKAPARGTVGGGRATCSIKMSKAARGTLKGTLTASAGGARLTKSFSVRLR
ncbi:MAG TPA: hypothetical protein VJ689_07105 [Gaiellaceae bacterium]|nr:hypothetical protein [Gaiellaceae bacterium]